MSPDLVASLDDEIRAFLHIAGVTFEPVAGTTQVRAMLEIDGFKRILYLQFGNVQTIAYWKRAVLDQLKWHHSYSARALRYA